LLHVAGYRLQRGAESGRVTGLPGMVQPLQESFSLLRPETSIASTKLQLGEMKARDRDHRTVLDAIGDGIVVLDEDASIVDMNRGALALFQLDDIGAMPSDLAEFFPDLFVDRPLPELLRHCRSLPAIDTRLTTMNGTIIPVQISTSEAVDGDRKLCVLVIRDMRSIISVQRRALQTERLAAVGETITALAHESRNALQRMQSCLTLLKLRANDEMMGLIEDMQEAQDQLQRLYEEVRGFAAPLQLQMETVDVVNLVYKIRRQLRLQWVQKDLTWSVRGAEDIETTIRADSRRLGQVIRNIMENAIEASPEGGRISIEFVETAVGDSPALEVRIADQGPGISDADRERVFDLLYTTKPDGTGMGLAIARRIMREHDGDIVLENYNGEGACVVVTLLRMGGA
jgi:PAS domain S-box-containing protein